MDGTKMEDVYEVEGRLWNAEVDYLRATAVRGKCDIDRAFSHFEAICHSSRAAHRPTNEGGNAASTLEELHWNGLGGYADKYHRYLSGSWGSLLQVSGYRAHFAASHLQIFTNIPRLDVQITTYPQEYGAATPSTAFKEYVSRRQGRRRSATPVLLTNPDSGDTLYIGKRGSNTRMLRVYEKGKEDKSGQYEGAIRYEFELTGHVALAAFLQLARHKFTRRAVAELTRGHLRELAFIDVVCDGTEPSVPDRRSEEGGDADALKWVREQVSPHVKKLIESGVKAHDIGQALGLSATTLAEMLVEAKKREEKTYRTALELECPGGMS